MRRCSLIVAAGLAAVIGSVAIAQPAKETTKKVTDHAKEAMKAPPAGDLPPGMTAEDMKDMQTCMEAGMPGPMHARLAERAGTWSGKNTMWMKPGAPAMTTDCTTVNTVIMDGRFIKSEMNGDMGGMPFQGFGLYGYDNVSKEFQASWIGNCGSGMMTGKGELSSDGKTLTWTYSGTCPLQKKEITFREVETFNGPDSMKVEMFGPDKTGKEFKMMEIVYTRTGKATPASATAPTGH